MGVEVGRRPEFQSGPGPFSPRSPLSPNRGDADRFARSASSKHQAGRGRLACDRRKVWPKRIASGRMAAGTESEKGRRPAIQPTWPKSSVAAPWAAARTGANGSSVRRQRVSALPREQSGSRVGGSKPSSEVSDVQSGRSIRCLERSFEMLLVPTEDDIRYAVTMSFPHGSAVHDPESALAGSQDVTRQACSCAAIDDPVMDFACGEWTPADPDVYPLMVGERFSKRQVIFSVEKTAQCKTGIIPQLALHGGHDSLIVVYRFLPAVVVVDNH